MLIWDRISPCQIFYPVNGKEKEIQPCNMTSMLESKMRQLHSGAVVSALT